MPSRQHVFATAHLVGLVTGSLFYVTALAEVGGVQVSLNILAIGFPLLFGTSLLLAFAWRRVQVGPNQGVARAVVALSGVMFTLSSGLGAVILWLATGDMWDSV